MGEETDRSAPEEEIKGWREREASSIPARARRLAATVASKLTSHCQSLATREARIGHDALAGTAAGQFGHLSHRS